MRRIHNLCGFLALAVTLGSLGLIAGCSEAGTAGDLPDSIGKVSTPEEKAEMIKKVEAGRTGYQGAPGVPSSGTMPKR
jgi:hypothetical protein